MARDSADDESLPAGAHSYDAVLARASDDARQTDRRLVDWARRNGWRTRTPPASRQLFDTDGHYALMLYPGRGVLEVSLRPFHLAGRSDLAAEILSAWGR